MSNPSVALVNGKEYKINTDFRVALECDKIARDTSIGDYERAMAIIYKIFGDEGLDSPEDYNKLLEIAQKYLSLGKDIDNSGKEPDMDFEQDYDYIVASFMSDYHIDLDKEEMHWYRFTNLLNGLSNSEMGSCCILNRIRNLRNFDTSQIKDEKEKRKIEEAKKEVALTKREKVFSKEQKESIEEFKRLIGM